MPWFGCGVWGVGFGQHPRLGFWAVCSGAKINHLSSAMGERPAFSASAMGTSSSASAKARMAYCE